ncbi:MAG: MBL fold metallo-hydrolase [Marinobacterium sp.]|nr:MBL fold metallo-hydrolase [Marinobacterium sp.]
MPELLHHGGADGVTGSCHQLYTGPDNQNVMIDCGLFQGRDEQRINPDKQPLLQALKFPPASLVGLQALVITHVHIDHIGRLPWLMAAGYRGPIFCSQPSAALLPAVMEDALAQGFTRKPRLIDSVIQQLHQQLCPLAYHTATTLWPGLQLTLLPAGHILGSAQVLLQQNNGPATLFSGDLGAPHSPLLCPPVPPPHCDHLILESTYGNRFHQRRRQRRNLLKQALQRALIDGGSVLIPAFSLGRTQELLYELEDIITSQRRTGGDLSRLEVILDSPLAERFTQLYRTMKPFWNAEAQQRLKRGRKPLCFDNLTTISDHHSHRQTVRYLADNHRPAVVIAASGMCSGGRIINYLKAMLGNPRHNVLFVGYQALGTPGRIIQQHGPHQGWVELDGQRITIRAGIETLSGYSAHADQKDLLRYIRQMEQPPQQITLVHGELKARQALQQQINQRWPAIKVVLAQRG